MLNTDAMKSVRSEVYPLGLGSVAVAADVRWMSLRRALRKLEKKESEGYVLANVSPRRWQTALRGIDLAEPTALSRRRLPERECEAALAPANLTWTFERQLRWRMLALGASAGSGMHMHVDTPPLASWHIQVAGRKEYTLCPPSESHGTRARASVPSNCSATTLDPGMSIFYPARWWHRTRTLEPGTASLSRSLISPAKGDAARTANALDEFFSCSAAPGAAAERGHGKLCDALRPCLQRLRQYT
jgi:hypothetical protein